MYFDYSLPPLSLISLPPLLIPLPPTVPSPISPFLSFMTFTLVVWLFRFTRDTCVTLGHNCPLELVSHHTCGEFSDCVLFQAGIQQPFSLFWLLEYFFLPSTIFSEPCSKLVYS